MSATELAIASEQDFFVRLRQMALIIADECPPDSLKKAIPKLNEAIKIANDRGVTDRVRPLSGEEVVGLYNNLFPQKLLGIGQWARESIISALVEHGVPEKVFADLPALDD